MNNCVVCGKPTEGKYSKNKFCSQKCRLANWRKNHANYKKVYTETHPEKTKEWARNSRDNRNEKIRTDAAYKARYSEVRNITDHRRKHRINRLPHTFTLADWKAALKYFGNKCAYCGQALTKAQKDHFVPITKGGGFTKDNIIPACTKCNTSKQAKNPIEWLVSLPNSLVVYAKIFLYFQSVK